MIHKPRAYSRPTECSYTRILCAPLSVYSKVCLFVCFYLLSYTDKNCKLYGAAWPDPWPGILSQFWEVFTSVSRSQGEVLLRERFGGKKNSKQEVEHLK